MLYSRKRGVILSGFAVTDLRHRSRGQNRHSYWTLLYNIVGLLLYQRATSRHVKMLGCGKILSVGGEIVGNMLRTCCRLLASRPLVVLPTCCATMFV